MSLVKLLKTSMMLSETSIYAFVCFALAITEHVIAHSEKKYPKLTLLVNNES